MAETTSSLLSLLELIPSNDLDSTAVTCAALGLRCGPFHLAIDLVLILDDELGVDVVACQGNLLHPLQDDGVGCDQEHLGQVGLAGTEDGTAVLGEQDGLVVAAGAGEGGVEGLGAVDVGAGFL